MSKFFENEGNSGWFECKARDMDIFKPEGKVITFWLHGDSEAHIREMINKKGYINIEWIKPPVDKLPFV